MLQPDLPPGWEHQSLGIALQFHPALALWHLLSTQHMGGSSLRAEMVRRQAPMS